jgi:hypothetical protein
MPVNPARASAGASGHKVKAAKSFPAQQRYRDSTSFDET